MVFKEAESVEFWLEIGGDSVMQFRGYREELLDQRGDDPDEFDQFTLRRTTLPGLVAAYQVFTKAGLRCELCVRVKSEKDGVSVAAGTGSVWSCDGAYGHIDIDPLVNSAEMAKAIKDAKEVLNRV